MPIFDFECPVCSWREEDKIVSSANKRLVCERCGSKMLPLPPLVNYSLKGANIGPKIKNRVALDDELRRQGKGAPLFRSEETKDFARWALKRKDRFI